MCFPQLCSSKVVPVDMKERNVGRYNSHFVFMCVKKTTIITICHLQCKIPSTVLVLVIVCIICDNIVLTKLVAGIWKGIDKKMQLHIGVQ